MRPHHVEDAIPFLYGSDQRVAQGGLEQEQADGFQDRTMGLNLSNLHGFTNINQGVQPIKVIEVTAGSFPSARHLSAKFPQVHSSLKRLSIGRTRASACV